MKPILFSIFSLCLLAGCKKEEQTTPTARICPTKCGTYTFTPGFNGFSGEELDSVTVRHYEADGTFTTLLSESHYTLADTLPFTQLSGNTPTIGYKGLSFATDQDHEVIVHATGQVFRVWDIVETDVVKDYDCSMKSKSCMQNPKSYQSSGGAMEIRQYYFAPVFLVMKR